MGAAALSWSDAWPDDDKPVGSWEELLRRGAPLFHSEIQAAPRPRGEQVGRYLVDNSLLRAPTSGLGFRRSKQLQDYDSTAAPWGGFVLGHDDGNGWLSVEDRYLPMSVQGLQVLTYVGPAFVATLRLCIVAAFGLTSISGSGPSACVVVRLGSDEQRTPAIANSSAPAWSSGNRFMLQVQDADRVLGLEILDCATTNHHRLGGIQLCLRGLEPRRWHRRRDRLEGDGFGELQYEVHLDPTEVVQTKAPLSPHCSSPQSPVSQASSLKAAWPAAFPHLLQSSLSCMAPVGAARPAFGQLQVPVQPASVHLQVDGGEPMQLPASAPVPSLDAPPFAHTALAPVLTPWPVPFENPNTERAASPELAALAERVDRVLRRCKLQLMKGSRGHALLTHRPDAGQLQMMRAAPRARSLDRDRLEDQELCADLEEVALRLGCSTGRSRSAYNSRSSQTSLRLQALGPGVRAGLPHLQAGCKENSAVSLLPCNSLGSQVINRVPASGSNTTERSDQGGVAAILAAASRRSAVDPTADILAATATRSTTQSLSLSVDGLQPAEAIENVNLSQAGRASGHHEDQSGHTVSAKDSWHCDMLLTQPRNMHKVPPPHLKAALIDGNQSVACSAGLVAQVENHCAALEACMARVRRDKALRGRIAGTAADVFLRV
mmetsp:Transcript_14124/g.27396  ORF Transcript_14124/g.27396 Transcript_14124/m.27396 type:complete len:661 (-) Transcript_14124:77-2059(-)